MASFSFPTAEVIYGDGRQGGTTVVVKVPQRILEATIETLRRKKPEGTDVQTMTTEIAETFSTALDELGVRYACIEVGMDFDPHVGGSIWFAARVDVMDDTSAVMVKLFGDSL